MKINGIDIVIEESKCQRTIVQEDGVTHIVDTENTYPYYRLNIGKGYFDVERKDIVAEVIKDLKGLLNELEKMENKTHQEEAERE